ncbi:peptidase family A16 [Ancylostoma caninum]|uniref:Peptidase family A16 n=1 Tax=Ancylostoma caninum TaxID=29170 RepID=A0A368FGL1_ANCCA|nr:peptidase family A16 [Ancylostoma caninum]
MSAQLRRQIGAIRKQLANAVKNCEEDLHLNISDFLAASTDDSNLDFMETLHAHRETILAKLNKLENLNETWSKLMAENNDEVKIFHDYIEKYGDYRSELNDAIKILEQIDTYDMLILEALEKRGISHELERDGRIPQQNQDKNVQRADDTHRDGTAYVLQNRNDFLSSRHHSISREDAHLNYFDASLLSRLDLPSFSGNLIEFPEFWSRFHTLVHSKTSLSGATKFSLLKSCLRGRALQCIEGLPITDEEYTTAIDILHMTYDNPSTIRHLIYTQLSSLPPCDSEGKQLQDLYLKMLRLVRQYTSITPGSPEYGLGALLYNKLPRFVKARIYDKTGGQKNLTPNELMTLLSDIVKKESTLRQVEQSTNSNHATYHALEKQGRPAPWKNAERRHAPARHAPSPVLHVRQRQLVPSANETSTMHISAKSSARQKKEEILPDT